MARMTDVELREIDEACANATPGPWGFAYDGSSDWSIGRTEDPQSKDGRVGVLWNPDDISARADVPFIAKARSWVPALVAECRRARASETRLLEALESVLSELTEPVEWEPSDAYLAARAAIKAAQEGTT